MTEWIRGKICSFLGYSGLEGKAPEIVAAPKRTRIVKRNHWVVKYSDFVVCYYKIGGVYEVYQYAKKQ